MNYKKTAGYILSGAKASENIGVELEHFITDANGVCAGYYGENGVGAVLGGLARFFDEKFYSEGHLIALSNGRYHLTLEPAAQLEISIEPLGRISGTEDVYNEFYELIAPELKKRGLYLTALGYKPAGKAADAPLIPKKRYEFMDRYFKNTGAHGINMMRATASAQVSIDYADERDCIQKFRLANALSPLFALITDNSPVYEGEPYRGRMVRTMIWDDVDPDRCGIVPGGLEKDFSVERYAEYVLGVPPVFIEKDGRAVYTGAKKCGELYGDMTDEDVEHVLSMVFPDVRLKKYIEIRPGDSMPIEYTLSYAAFIKGIFARTEEACRCVGLDSITGADAEKAKKALTARGFDAEVYGKNAHGLLLRLLELSGSALCGGDEKYIGRIEEIIKTKTTLKDRDTHCGGRGGTGGI